MNSNMPEDPGFDQTLNVLKEGYEFVMSRNTAYQSDVFETRILGQKTVCLTGSRAAELFYDNSRFRRRDAAPKRVEKTLFGEGGVQGLDGKAHEHRKAMFMGLMGPDEMTEIGNMTKKYWKEYFENRRPGSPVELYEAAKVVFLHVAC